METLILLATLMALFGVLGYQHGTRTGIFTAGAVYLIALVLDRFAGRVRSLVNGLYFGVRFVLAGGLPALGGVGDRGEAINRVITSMGEVRPLIGENGGLGFALVFGLLVACVVLVGRSKWLKTRSSWGGLWSGLVSGYVASAYLVGTLLPEAGVRFPLPLVEGAAAARPAVPAAAPAAAVSGFGDQLVQLVTQTLDERSLALVIVVGIALFVLLATRFSNRPGK
jgi:hypothetical protein